MTHLSSDSDSDPTYDVQTKEFTSVTAITAPQESSTHAYWRLYDEEANAIIYATGEGTMVLKDAGDFSG